MTKKRDLTPEQEAYLHEELELAHAEFHQMLVVWASRGANPTSVATVFATGVLVNLRNILTEEQYNFSVERILETVEELHQKNVDKGEEDEFGRTVH